MNVPNGNARMVRRVQEIQPASQHQRIQEIEPAAWNLADAGINEIIKDIEGGVFDATPRLRDFLSDAVNGMHSDTSDE